jgi:hypothetical protein
MFFWKCPRHVSVIDAKSEWADYGIPIELNVPQVAIACIVCNKFILAGFIRYAKKNSHTLIARIPFRLGNAFLEFFSELGKLVVRVHTKRG